MQCIHTCKVYSNLCFLNALVLDVFQELFFLDSWEVKEETFFGGAIDFVALALSDLMWNFSTDFAFRFGEEVHLNHPLTTR